MPLQTEPIALIHGGVHLLLDRRRAGLVTEALNVHARHPAKVLVRRAHRRGEGRGSLENQSRLRESDIFLGATAVKDCLEGFLFDRREALVLGHDQVRQNQSLRVVLSVLEQGLTVAEEKRGQIDQGLDFVGVLLGGLCDDDTAHAVPDEDHRF